MHVTKRENRRETIVGDETDRITTFDVEANSETVEDERRNTCRPLAIPKKMNHCKYLELTPCFFKIWQMPRTGRSRLGMVRVGFRIQLRLC